MRALPADVKGLVEEMRVATQTALTSRLSRIDIELPLGMGLVSGDKALDVHSSSRELAKVYLEMFSALSATTVVAFGTDALASAARQEFGNAYKAKCVSLSAGSGKKRGPAAASGFGAASVPAKSTPAKAGKSAGVPSSTEIIFAVGPFDAPALAAVESLSKRFGKGTLVALLNAHLDTDPFSSAAQRDYFMTEFERVFCFRPVRTAGEIPEDLLVYRAFPMQWTLARMRASGRPKEIAQQPGLFARDDIEQALVRAGPPEKGALETLSSFFKFGN